MNTQGLRVAICISVAALAAAPCAAQSFMRAPVRTFDSRALELLDRMAAAYTALPALDQVSEFSSALRAGAGASGAAPAGAEQKLKHTVRLLFQRPNLLRLENSDQDSEGQTTTSLAVSDGKKFWTYDAEKRAYTEEKAPARIEDFRKLTHLNNGSLELLMLMGVNPFAHVKEQVDSVTTESGDTVQSMPTDVVALRVDDHAQTTVVRLYIGQQDELLHRVVVDTTPTLITGNPTQAGDALDDLYGSGGPVGAPGSPPPPVPTTAPATRVTYENTLAAQSRPGIAAFVFQIPTGAKHYETYGQSLQSARDKDKAFLDQFLKNAKGTGKGKKVKVYRY